MRVVVLEDDYSARQRLEQFFIEYIQSKNLSIETSYFESPGPFFEEYKSQYDLILLDIQMPGMNGMKAAEKIRTLDERTLIVFITNLTQFAIDGYKVRALDYILKPISYFDFSNMMDTALHQLQSQERQSIVVNNKRESRRVLISNITYIEVQDHKLFIHTTDETIEAWGSLSALESELPPGMFSRINAGTSVNLNAVLNIVDGSVILPNDSLPISRRRKKEFCSDLARYFGRMGYE